MHFLIYMKCRPFDGRRQAESNIKSSNKVNRTLNPDISKSIHVRVFLNFHGFYVNETRKPHTSRCSKIENILSEAEGLKPYENTHRWRRDPRDAYILRARISVERRLVFYSYQCCYDLLFLVLILLAGMDYPPLCGGY